MKTIKANQLASLAQLPASIFQDQNNAGTFVGTNREQSRLSKKASALGQRMSEHCKMVQPVRVLRPEIQRLQLPNLHLQACQHTSGLKMMASSPSNSPSSQVELGTFLESSVMKMALETQVDCIRALPRFEESGQPSCPVHFIWFGSFDKAERYLSDVFQLKKANPELNVIVWADFDQTGFRNCLLANQVRKAQERVFFVDINNGAPALVQLSGFDTTLNHEVTDLISKFRHELHSPAGASDILRNLLLFKFGGVYCDLDDAKQLVAYHKEFQATLKTLHQQETAGESYLALDCNKIVIERASGQRFLYDEVKKDYATLSDKTDHLMRMHYTAPSDRFSNNIIVASPNHDFFIDALSEIVENCKAKLANRAEPETEPSNNQTTRRQVIEHQLALTGTTAQSQSIDKHPVQPMRIPCQSDQSWLNQ